MLFGHMIKEGQKIKSYVYKIISHEKLLSSNESINSDHVTIWYRSC